MKYIPREAPNQVVIRPNILKCYIENQVQYLKLIFPDVSIEELEKMVKQEAQKDLKIPDCEIITYPEPGECDLRTVNLLQFINNHRTDVITPAGTMFKSDPDNPPPSVKYCRDCNIARSHYKKLMFVCFEKGDLDGYSRNDKRQGLKKIKTNSIIGAHGFVGSPFHDKESFSGVTSLGRNGVILSYAITEQCLVNNFYWNDPEKVINHILTVAKASPSKEIIKEAITRFNLHVPTPEEIATRLCESTKYYLSKEKRKFTLEKAIDLLTQLPKHQQIYVFYRRSLINLFVYNSELFQHKIQGLFQLDKTLKLTDDYQQRLNDTQVEYFLTVDDDLKMMLSIIYNHILDYKSANKELVKDHPEVAREFSLICKTAENYLEQFEDIFSIFMYSGETLARIPETKYILRKSVAVSDTDSVIFTMKAIVSWYQQGDLSINQNSINMSAYTVYVLSQILNHANRDLAISKGVVTEENVKMINLKSEFLYTVFVKTDLGKHYFAKYIAKEGRMQSVPKLDIKGVEFQSSTLSKVTKDFTKKLMNLLIDDIHQHGNIYDTDFIGICIEYEKSILKSLQSGELNYYSNASIKEKSLYKKPESSIYFNYQLWTQVFEERYGIIHIPGKYCVVPFRDKIMRDPKYLKWMENGYPDIYRKYLDFISKIDKKKKITRILLPATINILPEIFIPAVDIRTIIYKNMSPAQLVLKQIGINLGKSKQQPLFLDHYSDLTDASFFTTY